MKPKKKVKTQEREEALKEVQEEVKKGETRALLGDSSDEEEKGIVFNKEYAQNYEHEKERKELDALKSKQQQLFDDDDSSDGTEEDEDGRLLNPERDYEILAALNDIRSGQKDRAATRISTVNTQVKSHLDEILAGKTSFKESKPKKTTMKDYMREKLLDLGAEGVADLEKNEEEALWKEHENKNVSRDEEADAKKAFLDAVAAEEEGFAIKKKKKQKEVELDDEGEGGGETAREKEQRVNAQLANLFSNVDPSDEKETFLKNFFMNNGWQNAGEDMALADADTIMKTGAEEEDFEEKQKTFEEDYEKTKYHHEEEDAAEIQTHPRAHQIKDSLRNETSTRKAARERKKERLAEEAVKRDEEVKRLKFLKRKEMDEKVKTLKGISSKAAEELFGLMDLDEDFDPTKWDEKMGAAFGDDYYDDEDDSFDPDDLRDDEDLELSDVTSSEEEEPAPKKEKHKQKADAKSERKERTAEEKKELEKRKRQLVKAKEEELGLDMKAYERLDYEDVIDGQKVRFKYKSVPQEMFGMTDDDILQYDDRTLNEIAPLKFYAPYRSKTDNARDRRIAQQNWATLPEHLKDPGQARPTSKKYRTGMEPVYIHHKDNEQVKGKDKKGKKKKAEEEKEAEEVEVAEEEEEKKKKKKKGKKVEEDKVGQEEKEGQAKAKRKREAAVPEEVAEEATPAPKKKKSKKVKKKAAA